MLLKILLKTGSFLKAKLKLTQARVSSFVCEGKGNCHIVSEAHTVSFQPARLAAWRRSLTDRKVSAMIKEMTMRVDETVAPGRTGGVVHDCRVRLSRSNASREEHV